MREQHSELNPLVTAMCLTRNRRSLLPQAIDNFIQQTYQQRQLLVLNDVDADDISDLIPSGHPEIKLVTIARLNIGAKRNKAVQLSPGKVIVHWDDDEYHAPGRIADQVGRLLASGKQVTGYHQFKARNEKGEMWLYDGQPTDPCGSSFCYWKAWAVEHPFGHYQIGEDVQFCAEANRFHQMIGASGVEFLVIGVHSANTDVKRMERHPFKRITSWGVSE